MALKPELLEKLDAFLVELNRKSSSVILPLFRGDHGLEDKRSRFGFDPVTEADKGAERAIRQAIAETFPGHGVIGEEYGSDRPDAEFVWVIDPVDGTAGFVAGIPLWTTLIALRHQGEPVLGSIGQPYIGELFIGSQAAGSRLMARGAQTRLAVRECPRLTDAVVATTSPEFFSGAELGSWRQVAQAARLVRYGCDAYAFAMVAAGMLDMALEGDCLKAWDIDAAVPVVEGAGGLACNWRGERVGREGGQLVLAGDRRVLDEALVTLKRSAR